MNTELENIIVIKLGGSVFASRDTSIEDIVKLQKNGYKLILVHGGANVTTKWMATHSGSRRRQCNHQMDG